MNRFKLNPVVVMVIVGALHSVATTQAISFTRYYPELVMAGYTNKIAAISYDKQSDEEQALSFLFTQMPICMYTPFNYQDALPDSLVRTYFLPRTQLVDKNMQRFYKDVERNLEGLGIGLVVQDIADQVAGVRIHFTIAPDSQYDIKKVLNKNTKNIQFIFYKKI